MKDKIQKLEKFAEIGRFSPSILHDVLNPLTGLMLYLDSIKGESMHLTSAKESSKKMRDFINIIQEFIHGEKEQVSDLDEIIQNVIKIVSTKARHNNISIIFIRKNRVRINCPPLFLYHIVINLLSNAIDAYDKIKDDRDKHINITLEQDSANFCIKIIDNGSGITESEKLRIFNQFYTTKESGTGTGLPTVKNILEKELNGSIEIESQIGIGSTFKALIPLKNRK